MRLLTIPRKPRVEAEINKLTPDSPAESSDDVIKQRTMGHGLDVCEQPVLDGFTAQEDPLSPFQGSVELEQTQHMPHLIC